MNWQSSWTQTVIGTLILGLVWLLCREALKRVLDKDVERFKRELDKDVERFKTELQKAVFEHQVRFSSLHEKQAEVVAQVYASLVQVDRDVLEYVKQFTYTTDPTHEQKIAAVEASYKAFRDCFYPRQIYLPKATRERVKALANKLAGVANKMTQGLKYGKLPSSAEGEPPKDLRGEAWDDFGRQIPQLLTALEDDFERLIGLSGVTGARDGSKETAGAGQGPVA